MAESPTARRAVRAAGPAWLSRLRLRPTLVTAAILLGLVVVAIPLAQAGTVTDWMLEGFGTICQAIVKFLGQLMLLVVSVLVSVAQYNNFVSEPAVGNGWVIVRDVCNMFFIAVLLLMAFGTIIPGLGQFTVKGGNLTKLLITAVVINFSRTICGLLIDLSQVIMLTFVSGFREAAGGNFVEALGINTILQSNPNADANLSANALAIVVAYLLAIVMTAIALFVVVVITVSLTVRIIYLWLLVILSPLAFFVRAVPAGFASGIYSQWWGMFIQFLVGGPLQAFFLWLALVTVQSGDFGPSPPVKTGEGFGGGISAAFQDANVQKFIVAVCLLLVGNMLAKQVAGAATGAGFKVAEFGKRAAAKYGRKGAALAGRGAVAAASRIPAGRTKSGERVTLGARLGVGIENLKESKVGRIFTKQGRADSATLRRAAALEASGRTGEADKLREEVLTKRARFVSRKSVDDLRAIASGQKGSKADAQQAVLALAMKKDEAMMGMGKTEIENMVTQASGGTPNKLVSDMVKKVLKDNGSIYTEHDADDLGKMDPKEMGQFIAKGKMTLASNGEMVQTEYDKWLRSGNAAQIAALPPSQQDKVIEHMTQGVAAHKAAGRMTEAQEMAKALADVLENKLSLIKPKDYEKMSNAQKETLERQTVNGAAAMREVGDTRAEERMQAKRMELSGREGMLAGIGQETASVAAGGSAATANALLDSYMTSFGKDSLATKQKDFDQMVPSKQEQLIDELSGVYQALKQVGGRDKEADDIEAKLKALVGPTITAANIAVDGNAALGQWSADAATRFAGDKDKGGKAMAEMSDKATKVRDEALAKGAVEISDVDKAFARTVRALSGKGAEDARKGADGIDQAIDRLAATGAVDPALVNVAMADLANAAAKGGPTGVRGADGRAIDPNDLFDKTAIKRHLEAALASTDTKIAGRHLREAAAELSRMAAKSERTTRERAFDRKGKVGSGIQAANSSFESALKRGDTKARAQGVRRAAGSALASLKVMTSADVKPGADRVAKEVPKLTEEQRKTVEFLRRELKKLQQTKDVDDVQTKSIRDDVMAKLEQLRKSL